MHGGCCAASPYAFPSLLSFTSPEHLTFGSDFPFAGAAPDAYFGAQLDQHFANDSAALAQIDSGTVTSLFPRFAARVLSV